MKRFALIVLAVFLSIGAEKNPRLAYIEKYAPLAVSEMERTGVPASITLAQGMLESNACQRQQSFRHKMPQRLDRQEDEV